MVGGEGEVEAVALGQAGARGSTCTKEKATAELLDTVGRREDDGGYGYSGEVAAAASAMARESEGEAMGANGGVQGLGGAMWMSSSSSTGEAASRWRRGELAHAGVTSVPALAGASS